MSMHEDATRKAAAGPRRSRSVPRSGDGDGANARQTVQELLAKHLGALEECGHNALLDMELAPPSWLVEGLIADDGLTWLGGKKKLGKAQPLDCPVLTPSGWRPMGDLQPGDKVIGSKGLPVRVVAIHPQGIRPVFRVSFSDQTSTTCTGDHLWLIRTHNDRHLGKPGRVLSALQIRAALLAGKTLRHNSIPLCQPVEFAPHDPLPVEPYLMGLLLGDGGLTKQVVLTSAEPELVAAAGACLPARHRLHPSPDGKSFAVVHERPRGKQNAVHAAFRRFDLIGRRTPEKFIPPEYLRASVAERMALLQGLLDTDGWVQDSRAHYGTTSAALARGVRELVESLGGVVTETIKEKWYSKDGGRVRVRPCHEQRFRLPRALGCPFRLSRKAADWFAAAPSYRTEPLRRIVSVEEDGLAPCQCITVDAQDGLYLTNNYIVTHNSWLCLQVAQAVAAGLECLGRTTAQGSVIYVCLEDGRRRVQSRLVKQHTTRDLPITYFTRFPALDGDGMGILLDLLAERKPRLLILDTLAAVKTGKVNENDSGPMADLANTLRVLGQFYHAGVLVTHHHGKMLRGDPGDDLRGSSALGGAGDVNLGLYREQSGHVLKGEGRDLPDDFSVPLFFDPADSWCWQVREDRRDTRRDQADQETLDALRGLGEADAATLAAYLGKSERRVGERLRKLVAEGLAFARPEAGPVGRPRILYRIDASDCDDDDCNPPGGF